ncbi:MAG: 4-phosphoerythronate dehydrogenase [Muribaculaceae bacterium]|nr:4-phosphoerythronate dehydrogenase [Muribaculaceae bacterium]
MDVIIENHIPFIHGKLEALGHRVTYLPPEGFTPQAVRNADALIIRTRTRCNADLLAGSRVKHIATATIGTDHIDLDYCRRAGIRVDNAPGCNAPAVAQYVLSTISAVRPQALTVGIIGVGHVGSIVNRWAQANGFRTLLNDPPLGLDTPLETLAAEADVITVHTPLDSSTRHLINAGFLAKCRRKPLIINAARGAIVDTPALIEALKNGQVYAAIDCWEGEPNISRELPGYCSVATPHIAGYSLEGKQRATAMALRAIDPRLDIELPPVADKPSLDAIAASYNPIADTAALLSATADFEALRNNYDYRPEPSEPNDYKSC